MVMSAFPFNSCNPLRQITKTRPEIPVHAEDESLNRVMIEKTESQAEEFESLFRRVQAGDSDAQERVFLNLQEELRRLAQKHMAQQPPGHTLQTTALLHEAFVKLFHGEGGPWKCKEHFLALASTAMRCILLDHARKRTSKKRTAGEVRVPLDDVIHVYEQKSGGDLLEFNDALERLKEMDSELAQLVELRFFGGLSVEDCAKVINKPKRSTERSLATARAWLRKELQ